MITTEKKQSNCKNVESDVLTDFFNLQRRAMVQNVSNLTKKVALEVPYNAWCSVKRNN
jgi:hypothetical protein